MGAPSAISSALASLSLTGGKTYDLSDVTSKKAEEVYEELDYSNAEIILDGKNYSATIEKLASDRNFIQEIVDKIYELLEKLEYQQASRVAGNIEVLSPTLIQIMDANQLIDGSNKTPEEIEQMVKDNIVNFTLEEKDLLSEYEFGKEATEIINKALEEMILDFYKGEDIYPTDAELAEIKDSGAETNYGTEFTKKVLGKFFGFTFKEYTDDVLSPVLAAMRTKFPTFMANYGDDMVDWTLAIIPSKFTDILFGGTITTEGILETYGEDIAGKILGETSAGISPVGSVVKNLFEISDDGFQMASSLGSFTQAKYTNMVDNLLNGRGTANTVLKKLFVPKSVTTAEQFYEKLIENTTVKATAVKAVKSGVASLVVTSIFSFSGGVVDAWNEGERDILDLAGAGASAVLDETPKIIATATGTAVGQVVGSVGGAAIGAALGGPVGAYIGEKIGGFLGSMIGGWIGSEVGDSVQQSLADNDVTWWNPLTWF